MMRPLGILLLALSTMLVLPVGASAADYWTSQAETCGGNDENERGSGQVDALGRMYLPCSRSTEYGFDNHIGVFNAAGQKVARIDLEFDRDGRNYRATDVAPSPDGQYLYVMRMGTGLVYRFVRQGNGFTYRADTQAEWSLDSFPWNGCMLRPQGQFLATDGNGDIYVSHGLWWNSGPVGAGCAGVRADTVVKYRPTATGGRFLSHFGQKGGDTWEPGKSRGAWGGVAVTATGDRVFVTDINNSRVQRFDRIPGTEQYAANTRVTIGRSGGSVEANWCYEETDQALSAPYDLAMSPNGELLVVSTSCTTGHVWLGVPFGTIEVYRYRQDGGAPRGVARILTAGKRRIHGISVDRSGNIHLVQGERVGLRPAGIDDRGADAGGGGPLGGAAVVDMTAPVITGLAAPATTTARTVAVTVDATDAVGVTEMRLRVDGAWRGWQPYARSFEHVLADRLGAHDLAVQVRDANGNVSGERAVAITLAAPAPAPQPASPDPAPAQPAPAGGNAQGGGGAAAPKPKPNPAAPAGGQRPVGGDVPTTVNGGGGNEVAASGPKPQITSMRMPVQLARGRVLSVRVRARVASNARARTRVQWVRFSTGNGRWSRWQRLRARNAVLLTRGVGWKGVLVQVRDNAGNRSTPWFQPVFHAPRGAQWRKGTARADRIRTGRGSQHIDASNFDRRRDIISCGSGFDTVLAQPEDRVARDCERVTRFRMPRW